MPPYQAMLERCRATNHPPFQLRVLPPWLRDSQRYARFCNSRPTHVCCVESGPLKEEKGRGECGVPPRWVHLRG